MDFDNRKVYGDTSITDGLVLTRRTGVKQGDIPSSCQPLAILMVVGWKKLLEGGVLCMKNMDSKKFGNYLGFYRLKTGKAEKEGLMAADREKNNEWSKERVRE